jgi:hypothetical protein
VSHAGATALLAVAEKTGLDQALSEELAGWRKPLAVHDPGKIVLDLAVAVAAGADCAADLSLLRTQPGVFGQVASDSTVFRLVTTLADSAPKALRALASAAATARTAAWKAAGEHAADHGIDADHPLPLDLDATLLDSHSDKQSAAPTYKRGYGFQCAMRRSDRIPGAAGMNSGGGSWVC